ncbi:MAG: hypothetical protein JWO31_1321, partial [Phycisphaerales bacterium]|nr:hypothetical protein [Phycisphaerales bacterium]
GDPESWRVALVRHLPFLAVLVGAAFLTGRPMLNYGFDWLSFCNDDMANYTLAADRFLNHGFLETPSAAELVRGEDYSLTYWFFHVPSMVRAGCELMIAWACATTGLSPHEAFMPLIVSFHLCLVSAAAALVCTSPARRTVALVTAALVAMSAEVTFGTVYQLIAQSCGLGILCTNLALLCRPFGGLTKGQLVRHGALVAVTLSTQLLVYPEVNPFLAAGFAVYSAVGLVRRDPATGRRRVRLLPLAGVLAAGALFTGVILNAYLYDATAFMLTQRGQAMFADDPEKTLFPFFLIPTGLANFWGLLRIAQTPMPDEYRHLFTVMILAGAGLMVVAAAAVAWLAWRGEPAGAVALVCAALAVPLFARNGAFGLYKLAMFSQPFVLGSLAVAWASLVVGWRWRPAVWRPEWRVPPARRAWLVPLVLLVNVPGMLRAQRGYVDFSQGRGATFNEIVGATSERLLEDVKRVAATPPPVPGTEPTLIFDTYNITLSKLLAVYTRGRPAAFPSSRLTGQSLSPIRTLDMTREAYKRATEALTHETFKYIHLTDFEYEPDRPGAARDTFYSYDQGNRPSAAPDPDDSLVVVSQRNLNLLNHRTFPGTEGPFAVTTVGRIRNHLVFHESDMSQPYYSVGDPKLISLYQIEQDPAFYVGQTMAGLGRYFLFEVLRPDDRVRFAVEMTCSLQADGENKLPANAAVVGADRVPMRMVGRGSARVFSDPFRPTPVHGRPHVAIDLGQWGKRFTMLRTGAMRAFGGRVALDRRMLVGFGRDVSLIGDAEYGALRPPTGVTRWGTPTSELRHPDLEYSGLYEDGWMAEEGYLALGQPPATAAAGAAAGRARVVVRGSVPDIGNPAFSTVLTVKVDGVPVRLAGTTGGSPVVDGRMVCGYFAVTADLPDPPAGTAAGAAGTGRRRVELA